MFPSADICTKCHSEIAPQWVDAVTIAGRPLAGTGGWQSQLSEGVCPSCWQDLKDRAQEKRRQLALQFRLLSLAGEKGLREFRFDTFEVTPENRLAFIRASGFHPGRDNLYLWGPCGVGKTHLAFAIVRRFVEDVWRQLLLPVNDNYSSLLTTTTLFAKHC